MGITLFEFRLLKDMEKIRELMNRFHSSAFQRGRMRAFNKLCTILKTEPYECLLFVHAAYFGEYEVNPVIYYEAMIYNRKNTSHSLISKYYQSDEAENRFEIYDKMCDFFGVNIRYVYTKEEKFALRQLTKAHDRLYHMRICKTCERLCRENNIKNYVMQKEYPRIMQIRQSIVRLFLKIEIPGRPPRIFYSDYYNKNLLKNSKGVYLEALASISAKAIQFILSEIFSC